MAFDSATPTEKFVTLVYNKQSNVHPEQVFSTLRKPGNSAVFLISFLIYLVGIFPSMVFALPSDPIVQSGSVTIDTTSPEKMNIYQSTNKAIIDWNSFNVDTHEHVEFQLEPGTWNSGC